ncbi:MAG: 4a-hydroxytetrahydrobiopterin dehydratase [Patescibacteria group bacterium]
MSDLTKKKCIPCEKKGMKAFDRERAEEYMVDVKGWTLAEEGLPQKISREFEFKDFVEALEFVNRVGDIAELEGHHPDIFLHDWNKVTVTLWTHSIGGLSENDYIVAAKINEVK